MVTSELEEAIRETIDPVMIESGLTYIRTNVYMENVYIRTNVYKAKWSTDEVEHFVYLSAIKNRGMVLKSDFGLRNFVAEVFACRIIHSYGGDLFKEFKCDE